MRALPVLLIAALSVSGCARLAESRFNPVNWFAGSTTDPDAPLRPLVPAGGGTLVVDGRQPVAEVLSVGLDRTPDGAILRATGLAATQGWFNAQLVLVSVEGGTATYAFRAEPPRGFEPEGSATSRRITAAADLDLADLAGIRSFRVTGAANSRSVGR